MSLVTASDKDTKLERYSFSKLSAWWTCPYGYKLKYIDHKDGIGNAFASFGTLIHSLMERYAKGEAEIWDLPALYEWEFDAAIPEKFPYNKFVVLRDSYYKQGLEFLKNFQGYGKYKLLGIEEEFTIPIEDWSFTGIVDLVFEDELGRLIIRDYKSKASFKNAKEQQKYARQLYLYALYVKEKYGRYPDELQFMMFRKQKIVNIPFNLEELEEALSWAKMTVRIIREAFDFPATCEEFYGTNLCNFRKNCDLKPKFKTQTRNR